MSCPRKPPGRPDKVSRAVQSAFQPTCERDLQCFPPLTGECRRIRAMLRDYCDDELTSFLQGEVDEHVHGCRDCGLALSRHELEVLRLRNGFQQERSLAEDVPKELTRAVMARVEGLGHAGRGDRAGRSLPGDDRAPVPHGFTGRVMDRVRMEWRPSHPNERALAIMRKGLLLIPLAALMVVAALFWSSLLTSPELAPAYHLESLTAGSLSIQTEDGRWRRLPVAPASDHSPGSVLLAGTRLEVGEGGSARIRLENEGGVAQLRAELEADTSIELGVAHLLMVRGAMAIEGRGRIQVADLCDLRLLDSPPGFELRGHLSLVEVQRPDHALHSDSPLRLRLEIQSGRAEIWRAGERLLTVRAGQVAELDDWSGVRVEPALTSALLQRSRRNGLRPGRDPFQSMHAAWRGVLRGALSGEGLAGVEVELGSGPVQVTITTAMDGSFLIPEGLVPEGLVPEGLLHRGLLVVRVRSQEATFGYASYGPEPIDLQHLRMGQLPAIELPVDRPVSGVLRGLDRKTLAAARILPVLVDELFQLVEPIEVCAVLTDGEGRFVLRGLPVDLPVHQRLSLLVEHQDYPRQAFVEPGRRLRGQSRSGLDLVLAPGRELRLAGLPLGERSTVFEAISGLPRRALAVGHDLRADSEGVVVIRQAGSGPFWYLDLAHDQLVELLAPSSGREPFRMPIADGPALGHRYAWLGGEVELGSADAHARVVIEDGLQPVAVPGARLFLSIEASPPRYLGRYDGTNALQFAVPRDRSYALYGVGPQGVGTLSSGMMPDPDMEAVAALRLYGSGSVVLTLAGADAAPQLGSQAALLLRFLRLDGILAGDCYWRLLSVQEDRRSGQLPAGRYRIIGPTGDMGECRVAVGEQTEIAYPRDR